MEKGGKDYADELERKFGANKWPNSDTNRLNFYKRSFL